MSSNSGRLVSTMPDGEPGMDGPCQSTGRAAEVERGLPPVPHNMPLCTGARADAGPDDDALNSGNGAEVISVPGCPLSPGQNP
mmetsp:Transcript_33151/g.98673  ORF Transcript_33151/g.98673 Transcript_33151/m.98673 type:complete len:83 (+) Transcript_33151:1382-1630(+)|eukprot:365130-Chlamydomonas_euryale.AAC.9